MTAIPSDAYLRLMLDGASPAAFDPLFFKAIETEGVLAPFQRLNYPLTIFARAYDLMEPLPGSLPCITKSE